MFPDKFVSIMYRLLKHRSLINRKPTLAVYVDAWDTFKSFFNGLIGTWIARAPAPMVAFQH